VESVNCKFGEYPYIDALRRSWGAGSGGIRHRCECLLSNVYKTYGTAPSIRIL